MTSKQILFMGGCPRSGTTALWQLLSSHPEIFLGNERYIHAFMRKENPAEFFGKDRFLDLRERDTHAAVRGQFGRYADPSAKYDAARIVGDKLPPIYSFYDQIWSAFPEARILYIVRNPLSVAESYEVRLKDENDDWKHSYQTAINDWNESVTRTKQEIDSGRPITVVAYERLFASRDAIAQVFRALGVEPGLAPEAAVVEALTGFQRLSGKQGPRNEEIRFAISEKARFQPYRQLLRDRCLLKAPPELAA